MNKYIFTVTDTKNLQVCKFKKKFLQKSTSYLKMHYLCIGNVKQSHKHRERCQSDRMDRTRNPAYGFYRTVGLNPTLSAK